MGRDEHFCHECGSHTERHNEHLHAQRQDPRLCTLETRIRELRAALPGRGLGELIRAITLRLDDGSGTPVARSVFFRSWPGSGRWWSDPVFAVVYGTGSVVHRRSIGAPGDERGPTIDLPLESGIAPYREAEPRLLGWAAGAGRGYLISADPADADPAFADRPSSERERIFSAHAELFRLETEYAELRDTLAPLRQRKGHPLAPRDYPLSGRSDGADLFARERFLAERLRALGESTAFPEIAVEADLWRIAVRRGLASGEETLIAARLAGRRWSYAGD